MSFAFIFAGINERLNKGCISILYNELGIERSDKDYRYLRLELSNFSALQTEISWGSLIADSIQITASAKLNVYAIAAFELHLQEYNHHLLLKTYPTLAIKLIDMEKTAKCVCYLTGKS